MIKNAAAPMFATAAVLLQVLGSCAPKPAEAAQYISVDNKESFLADRSKYHFGPLLIADTADVLKRGNSLTFQGDCYQIGLIAFAHFSHGEIKCGDYVIRRVNGVDGPVEVYEVRCIPKTLCPAQTWQMPAGRYYLNRAGSLLGFELRPGDPNQLTFVRVSEVSFEVDARNHPHLPSATSG